MKTKNRILATEIAGSEAATLSIPMQTPGKQISLYFHIPFCKRKCDYCHFYVIPDKDIFKLNYMEGIKLEWDKILPVLSDAEICSIYFGGGTPFLLGPKPIGIILSWIYSALNVISNAEITLEANPEDISLDKMKEFASIGINRLSIGLQSLDDSLLKTLSRQHNAQKAKNAVYCVYNAGISNISVDLMYDLPGQKLEQWAATLNEALDLPITHLSLYNLTFEPHTVYYKKQALLTPQLPNQETSAAMYRSAVEECHKHGFEQYEISAFAKQGFHSRHNIGYWLGRPFWGFGPSAFSYWESSRFRNCANLNQYLKSLRSGLSPTDYTEKLEGVDRLRELLTINLRLLEGVDLSAFQLTNGILDQETLQTIKSLVQCGWLEQKESRIRLSCRGILFYDSVASELI